MRVFLKIVLISGILNFPIGLGMIVPSLHKPNIETIIPNVVAGLFILFAGAVLIYSSKDIQTRAPFIVWSGIVRFFGAITVFYTSTIGIVPKEMILISFLDVLLALTYFVGCVKYTKISFIKLLIGKINNSKV